MKGAGLGSKYLVEAGKRVQTVTCSFWGSSCSRHGSITPWPLSASPRCFEYHSRIWSRLADLKKTPPIPRMRPRCSVLTGGFDFSGCGDFTSCPPVERAEMSNSDPSAIVLHGSPCIGGLYKFRFEWRKRFGGWPTFTYSTYRVFSKVAGLALSNQKRLPLEEVGRVARPIAK